MGGGGFVGMVGKINARIILTSAKVEVEAELGNEDFLLTELSRIMK